MQQANTELRDLGHSKAFGYACGVTMAIGASVSFAAARAGITGGLAADDLILVRFGVASLVMLPAFVWWGCASLAGIGWRRGIALLLTGGPLFALAQTGGYAFAPLAHGGVIAPSTVTVLSTLGAAVLLGEVLTRSHIVGSAIVLCGILLVAWQGLSGSGSGDGTLVWLGDLLFFGSSVLWAGFTLLMRHWKIDAARATAVLAILSFATFAPAYLTVRGLDHILHLPLPQLLLQGAAQGLLQSVITLMAYSRAVAILGVSKAVLFPALVPALSVVIGIPLLGENPSSSQVAGLVAVSFGMLIAVGVFDRLAAQRTANSTTSRSS